MSVPTRSLEELHRLEDAPVLVGRLGDRAVNDDLFRPVWERTRRGWLALLGICASLTGLLVFAASYTFYKSIGA